MEKRVLDIFKYTIFVVLAIAGTYYLFPYFNRSKINIREFAGNIVSIKDEVITLRGVFVGSLGTVPKDFASARDFSFRVDSSTVFKKLETRLPTWEELKATGATSGSYKIEDLPRTESAGSFDDFRGLLNKEGVSVKADFTASILNSVNPIASLVFYYILVPPSPFSPQTQ